MADLNALCDALEATIIAYYVAQGEQIQVYSEVPGSVVSPAIVAEPGDGEYHAVMGASGGTDYVIAVHAMVALGDRVSAQRMLNAMISDSGARSVVAAIHSDRTLGGVVRYADPKRYHDYGTREFGGAAYLMCTVDVSVFML